MSVKVGTPEQEATHKAEVLDACHYAMLDLRRTLDPKFNPREGGYGETVAEAREQMIKSAWKNIDKLTAKYLASLK